MCFAYNEEHKITIYNPSKPTTFITVKINDNILAAHSIISKAITYLRMLVNKKSAMGLLKEQIQIK